MLLDEKTVLFDTVDWSICRQFLENVEHVLDGRDLDYLVINHMEPDHGASIEEILLRYPNVTIISTEKSIMLMHQFGFDVDDIAVELTRNNAKKGRSRLKAYSKTAGYLKIQPDRGFDNNC